MHPLRTAVVGLGAIGQEHLASYASLSTAKISAVVDANFATAQSAAVVHGCRSFGSVAELLASGIDFDAASLCTPDDVHTADALALIGAGKDVLVEKPVATTVAEAEAIRQHADDSQVIAMPGHTLRFEPRYHHAHQVVSEDGIGDVLYGYVRRDNRGEVAARAGGRVSVAWFLGIHDVDALMWITGQPVAAVQAMASDSRDASGRQSVAIMANLQLRNGNIVQLESAWALPTTSPTDLDSSLRLVGTKGEISVDTYSSGMRIADNTFTYPMPAGMPMYGRSQGPLHEELACFVDTCHTRNTPPPVTMAEAVQAVRVVTAIEQAVATGERIAVAQP